MAWRLIELQWVEPTVPIARESTYSGLRVIRRCLYSFVNSTDIDEPGHIPPFKEIACTNRGRSRKFSGSLIFSPFVILVI